MGDNIQLYNFQNIAFDFVTYITYFLYAFIALSTSFTDRFYLDARYYLENLQFFIRIYISLFLLYRFNPFRTIKFNNLDTKIAFNAGLFLLTTTLINSALITYFEQLRYNIKMKEEEKKTM